VRVLAFDTATAATTVALCDSTGGEPTAARDDPEAGQRPNHTTRLMELIVDVLSRSGCSWADVDRIAVGVGPGTFTGLRIGVATARALAHARVIELVGISTLQSLALAAVGEAHSRNADTIMPVLDARRGEVFAAAWKVDAVGGAPGHGRLLPPLAIAPSVLAQTAAQVGDRRLMIGDGAIAFRAVLACSGTSIVDDSSSLHRVDAVFTGQLAFGSDSVATGDVRPEYLRVPDAERSLQAAADKR
jgi:tRNA threonylcarbamoyladenosine biosynthesis protein TsaB